MSTKYLSVNESHLFAFPNIDFIGQASGARVAGPDLKLPSEGNWWIWGILATRLTTGAVGELASGTDLGLNIYDPALSQYWWTGGTANDSVLLPIQFVAGKAGRPAIFAEPKLVKGGSILKPYVDQKSGATPTGSSLLSIVLLATLADSSIGQMPMVPSLSKVTNEDKGMHYKARVPTDFATNNLAPGASRQFTLPLNKQTSFLLQQLQGDFPTNDSTLMDPRVSEPNILVNMMDTRSTWKWSTPQDVPASLFLSNYGALPFTAPSFFYMEADQNLAFMVTNNTPAALTTNYSFVADGFLNQNQIADRI
jgi:hypothetical protein